MCLQFSVMIKVLLIEDEIKAVNSLVKGFKEHDFSVDYATDGKAGLKKALNNKYDVVVSDIVMPEMSGIQIVKSLRDNDNPVPILLLTALDSLEDKIRGLEIGADDYLVKPFEFRELVARITALGRRNKQKNNTNKLIFDTVEMDLDLKMVKRQGKIINLTPKEFALMEYFIQNKNRVISKQEIAEEVWDIQFETSTNFVEVYVNYLRNKIDKPFCRKYIHTVFGVGYVLREELDHQS